MHTLLLISFYLLIPNNSWSEYYKGDYLEVEESRGSFLAFDWEILCETNATQKVTVNHSYLLVVGLRYIDKKGSDDLLKSPKSPLKSPISPLNLLKCGLMVYIIPQFMDFHFKLEKKIPQGAKKKVPLH